ncbi:hypothetical protein [Burkholderia cepacia]|uniref:hypothetical protein n=1 Tax=Burkholderia cepacia TaxID=292 RepID=UPI003527FE8B
MARRQRREPYTRWDDTNDHTEIIEPQCRSCAHWHKGTLVCDAFPEAPGIPDAILSNTVIHDHAVEGDHGIQFEPKA